MTREEYYAQIKAMYVQKYESRDKEIEAEDWNVRVRDCLERISEELHVLKLSYRSKKEYHEDQVLNDEESVDTEVATESIEIEHGTVKLEANAEVISAIVKKKQIPQIQYVVGCDELSEHQRSKLQVSLVKERNVLVTESASVTIYQVTRQLFDKMPIRVQSRRGYTKGHKTWRFKFKQRKQPRGKLLSAHQLIHRGNVRSKFRDKNFQKMVRGHGHFSHLKLKSDMGEDDEMFTGAKAVSMRFLLGITVGITESDASLGQQAVYEKSVGSDRFKEVIAIVKLTQEPWDNQVWEPGGVLIEHDRWKELEKGCKHGRLIRLMQPLSSMWWQLSKSRELERLGACSLADIETWLDLCSREYKNRKLLLDYHGVEMQVLSCLLEIGVKQDKNRLSRDVRAKIFMALGELHLLQDVFEMVKKLLLKTSFVSQQVVNNTKLKLSKRWWFKYKYGKEDIQRQRIQLRYKSWLEFEERFKGWRKHKNMQLQVILNMLFVRIRPESKEVLSRVNWLFQNSLVHHQQTVSADGVRHIMVCVDKSDGQWFWMVFVRRPAIQESAISATQEPAIFQPDNAHGMLTRGKDDEFEQVMNHTPFSVVKLGRLMDPDALLLLLHGDESFQIKHKWRFKLLLSILEWELYLDRLVLITSYAHQLDIISLIILMRVELSVFFSTKPDGFFFSTNLEDKVSLKGEDVIQEKRMRGWARVAREKEIGCWTRGSS